MKRKIYRRHNVSRYNKQEGRGDSSEAVWGPENKENIRKKRRKEATKGLPLRELGVGDELLNQ